MAAKKKKPAVLRAEGVRFCTLCSKEQAIVIAQNGVVMLHIPRTGAVLLPPAGLPIEVGMFNKQINVFVRSITGETLLSMGQDDILEDDIVDDATIVPVDNWAEIENLYTETKLRIFSKSAGRFSTAVAGLCLCGVALYLLSCGFIFPFVAAVLSAVGFLAAILLGIAPSINTVRLLNADILADSNRNYINVKNGKTNLNGGMTIPVE